MAARTKTKSVMDCLGILENTRNKPGDPKRKDAFRTLCRRLGVNTKGCKYTVLIV